MAAKRGLKRHASRSPLGRVPRLPLPRVTCGTNQQKSHGHQPCRSKPSHRSSARAYTTPRPRFRALFPPGTWQPRSAHCVPARPPKLLSFSHGSAAQLHTTQATQPPSSFPSVLAAMSYNKTASITAETINPRVRLAHASFSWYF